MHKMNKVISAAEWDVACGREWGGSLYACAEKSSALRASAAEVRAQLLLGVKGTPAGWTGARDLTKPVVSNKDISDWPLTDPFPKLLNMLHSNFALVCITFHSQTPISLVKNLTYTVKTFIFVSFGFDLIWKSTFLHR